MVLYTQKKYSTERNGIQEGELQIQKYKIKSKPKPPKQNPAQNKKIETAEKNDKEKGLPYSIWKIIDVIPTQLLRKEIFHPSTSR